MIALKILASFAVFVAFVAVVFLFVGLIFWLLDRVKDLWERCLTAGVRDKINTVIGVVIPIVMVLFAIGGGTWVAYDILFGGR